MLQGREEHCRYDMEARALQMGRERGTGGHGDGAYLIGVAFGVG